MCVWGHYSHCSTGEQRWLVEITVERGTLSSTTTAASSHTWTQHSTSAALCCSSPCKFDLFYVFSNGANRHFMSFILTLICYHIHHLWRSNCEREREWRGCLFHQLSLKSSQRLNLHQENGWDYESSSSTGVFKGASTLHCVWLVWCIMCVGYSSHQMCINPLLKIVPDRCTVSSCVSYISWEPQCSAVLGNDRAFKYVLWRTDGLRVEC